MVAHNIKAPLKLGCENGWSDHWNEGNSFKRIIFNWEMKTDIGVKKIALISFIAVYRYIDDTG